MRRRDYLFSLGKKQPSTETFQKGINISPDKKAWTVWYIQAICGFQCHFLETYWNCLFVGFISLRNIRPWKKKNDGKNTASCVTLFFVSVGHVKHSHCCHLLEESFMISLSARACTCVTNLEWPFLHECYALSKSATAPWETSKCQSGCLTPLAVYLGGSILPCKSLFWGTLWLPSGYLT